MVNPYCTVRKCNGEFSGSRLEQSCRFLCPRWQGLGVNTKLYVRFQQDNEMSFYSITGSPPTPFSRWLPGSGFEWEQTSTAFSLRAFRGRILKKRVLLTKEAEGVR